MSRSFWDKENPAQGRAEEPLTLDICGTIEPEPSPRHLVELARVQLGDFPAVTCAPVRDGGTTFEPELAGQFASGSVVGDSVIYSHGAILSRSCEVVKHHRETDSLYRESVPVLQKDKEFPDLASRIAHIALHQFNDNKSEMARALGCGSGTIGNWLSRNHKMDATYAFILQDHFRWNARWILEGILPRRIGVSDEEADALYQRILSLPADRRKALSLILGGNSD